ncbi:hypothetical protein [uncultured Winogradskyella sp.]|uniref:hypothetical protein n=1 Tax=uncultured Winogradskyella sp. TaxID=395353 RepID=UPI0026376C24|nr:hypothetical protein [uncultured Winogradskyella sp.]
MRLSNSLLGGGAVGGGALGGALGGAVGGTASGGGLGGLLGGFGGIGNITNILGGILDFDLGQNLSNVFQYGLSSWGAGTNPEQEMQTLSNYMNPIIEDSVSKMNDSNIGETLSYIDAFHAFVYLAYKYLRKHHANAGSTKAAHEKAMDVVTKMRKDVVDGLVNSLQSAGYTVTNSSEVRNHKELDEVFQWHNGGDFGTKSLESTSIRIFKVVPPLTGVASGINTGASVGSSGGATPPNEPNNGSRSNTLVYGGIAYAAAKLFGLI